MDWTYVFLHVRWSTCSRGCTRSGNAIVVASSTSVVLALTWGGVEFAWTSAHVLAPLILGLIGIAFWLVYEAVWATHPIVCPLNILDA